MEEREIIFFETMDDWNDWLEINGSSSIGIAMRLAKKGTSFKTISYSEALESALCYGWIDARRNSLDAVSFIQHFTPRKPGSKWSVVNREKVLQLIDEGKMKPTGLKAIEEAKKRGTWERAYEPQSTIQIPEELERGLSTTARMFFDSLDSRNRYAVLHRIQTAVKPETREKRIQQFISMLEAGQKIY